MDDFIKIVSHVRRFKSVTKDLSIAELTEIQNKLEKIIEDRVAADAKEKLKNAEKEQKIENYRVMLAADGIELEELITDLPVKKTKRAPRPAKYEIKDNSGKTVTWTGQGRMPNVFKTRIEAGDSIDTFLIK